jgi:hypothetical protein
MSGLNRLEIGPGFVNDQRASCDMVTFGLGGRNASNVKKWEAFAQKSAQQWKNYVPVATRTRSKTRKSASRKSASRKSASRKSASRKSASRKSASRKSASRRSASRR